VLPFTAVNRARGIGPSGSWFFRHAGPIFSCTEN
jgi:hypothetical protein